MYGIAVMYWERGAWWLWDTAYKEDGVRKLQAELRKLGLKSKVIR